MSLRPITHLWQVRPGVYEMLSLDDETAEFDLANLGLKICLTCSCYVRPNEEGECPFCETQLITRIEPQTAPSDDHVWCTECETFVEPEGGLDADGIYSYCPECNSELED